MKQNQTESQKESIIVKNYFGTLKDQDILKKEDDSSTNFKTLTLTNPKETTQTDQKVEKPITEEKEFISQLAKVKEIKSFKNFDEKYWQFLEFYKQFQYKEEQDNEKIQEKKQKNKEQQRKYIYNLIKTFLKQNFNKKCKKLLIKNMTRSQYMDKIQTKIFNKIFLQHCELDENQKNQIKFNLKTINSLLDCPIIKSIILEFLQSKQVTQLYYIKVKKNIKSTLDTFKNQMLLYQNQTGMNKLEKDEFLKPSKFSKVPFTRQNFEIAKKNFLEDFFRK